MSSRTVLLFDLPPPVLVIVDLYRRPTRMDHISGFTRERKKRKKKNRIVGPVTFSNDIRTSDQKKKLTFSRYSDREFFKTFSSRETYNTRANEVCRGEEKRSRAAPITIVVYVYGYTTVQ